MRGRRLPRKRSRIGNTPQTTLSADTLRKGMDRRRVKKAPLGGRKVYTPIASVNRDNVRLLRYSCARDKHVSSPLRLREIISDAGGPLGAIARILGGMGTAPPCQDFRELFRVLREERISVLGPQPYRVAPELSTPPRDRDQVAWIIRGTIDDICGSRWIKLRRDSLYYFDVTIFFCISIIFVKIKRVEEKECEGNRLIMFMVSFRKNSNLNDLR